jgi:branched-chain amino acid transport system substrate-binding protein
MKIFGKFASAGLLAISLGTVVLAGNATPAAAIDPGNYKIGFIADRTGVVAFAGVSYAQGAELAVEQINASGALGEGAKLEIVEREGASDPARSIQGYNQLVADRDIIATSCCIFSSIAGALKPVAIRNEVPLVIYGATLPGLPEVPWVYSVTALPGIQEVALSKHLVEVLKPKTVAYFVLADNEPFQQRFKASQEVFEAAGAKTVGVATALGHDTDFTAQATQLIALKPDLIMIYVTQIPAAGFIQAVRARGWEGQMATNEAISPIAVFEKIGSALKGVPFGVSFTADLARTDDAKAFVNSYREKYGSDPDVYAAQGYTAMQFIAQGLETLDGKPTRQALADAMSKLDTIKNDVYGGVKFNDGQIEVDTSLFVSWTADGKLAPWKP